MEAIKTEFWGDKILLTILPPALSAGAVPGKFFT